MPEYRPDEEMFGCPNCGHCDCTCGQPQMPEFVKQQVRVCKAAIRAYWDTRSRFLSTYGPDRGSYEWKGYPQRANLVIGARNAWKYIRKVQAICAKEGVRFPSSLLP